MIEATIKEIYFGPLRTRQSLKGARVSMSEFSRYQGSPRYSFVIGGILRLPKGSRVRKEVYVNRYVYGVELEDIVVDEFEID